MLEFNINGILNEMKTQKCVLNDAKLCLLFLKFPEETESELLCVSPDEPPHPHPRHHHPLHHHHPHHHPLTPGSEGHYPVFSAPTTPAVFSPALPFQHDGGHHQGELSSSSSEDTDKDEDYERVRPFSYRRPLYVLSSSSFYSLFEGTVSKNQKSLFVAAPCGQSLNCSLLQWCVQSFSG